MILIVDDDSFVRNALAMLAENSGRDCFEAKDGNEALGILRNLIPALVILDNQMPGLSGLEVLKLIRKNPVYKNLRIVMHTAEPAQIEREALELGADLVLAKGSSDSWLRLMEEMEQVEPERKLRCA